MSMSCLCGDGSSLWLLLSFDSLPLFPHIGGRGCSGQPILSRPSGVSCVQWKASGFREGEEKRAAGHSLWPGCTYWCGGFRGRQSNTIKMGLWSRQLGLKKEEEEKMGVEGAQRSVTWPQCPAGGGHFAAHLRPRARWPSGDVDKHPTQAESSS